MLEVNKIVENITKNKFKLSPEKPYELAKSYEFASYELAEYPYKLQAVTVTVTC